MIRSFSHSEETGTASMLALIFLLMLLFFSTALFYFAQSEAKTYQRFERGILLQLEAQNNIWSVCELLNRNEDLQQRLTAAPEHIELLGENTGSDRQGACRVYGKLHGDKIILLAISRLETQKMRVIAYLKKVGNRYVIDHWEH